MISLMISPPRSESRELEENDSKEKQMVEEKEKENGVESPPRVSISSLRIFTLNIFQLSILHLSINPPAFEPTFHGCETFAQFAV